MFDRGKNVSSVWKIPSMWRILHAGLSGGIVGERGLCARVIQHIVREGIALLLSKKQYKIY